MCIGMPSMPMQYLQMWLATGNKFTKITIIEKKKEKTYNAPEYFVGSGATMDLFILFISACISCSMKYKMRKLNKDAIRNSTSLSEIIKPSTKLRVLMTKVSDHEFHPIHNKLNYFHTVEMIMLNKLWEDKLKTVNF